MKIYEGKRINPRDTWLGEYVVTINNAPLQNPKPAEGDFSWGYSGTRPYNLARVILTDCIGEKRALLPSSANWSTVRSTGSANLLSASSSFTGAWRVNCSNSTPASSRNAAAAAK